MCVDVNFSRHIPGVWRNERRYRPETGDVMYLDSSQPGTTQMVSQQIFLIKQLYCNACLLIHSGFYPLGKKCDIFQYFPVSIRSCTAEKRPRSYWVSMPTNLPTGNINWPGNYDNQCCGCIRLYRKHVTTYKHNINSTCMASARLQKKNNIFALV